jgi:hypothetical protein
MKQELINSMIDNKITLFNVDDSILDYLIDNDQTSYLRDTLTIHKDIVIYIKHKENGLYYDGYDYLMIISTEIFNYQLLKAKVRKRKLNKLK